REMERAPGAGIGALSDPPGCGKWAGHHYNVPTAREIPGQKVKKEARPVIAPPPAHAAAHFAADAMRDSRRTDLFPQIAPGDCQDWRMVAMSRNKLALTRARG